MATEPPFPSQLHQPKFHGHENHGMEAKVLIGSGELGSLLASLCAQAYQNRHLKADNMWMIR